MMKDLLLRKPGNEIAVLSESAKQGLTALDTLVSDRNALAVEVQSQRKVIDRLTMENEGLRLACGEMQNQRDFWMRTHAKLEANLNQLNSIIQMMWNEFRRPGANATEVKQLAERFAPEKSNAKSVA